MSLRNPSFQQYDSVNSDDVMVIKQPSKNNLMKKDLSSIFGRQSKGMHLFETMGMEHSLKLVSFMERIVLMMAICRLLLILRKMEISICSTWACDPGTKAYQYPSASISKSRFFIQPTHNFIERRYSHSNRDAVGAKVQVTLPDGTTMIREMDIRKWCFTK